MRQQLLHMHSVVGSENAASWQDADVMASEFGLASDCEAVMSNFLTLFLDAFFYLVEAHLEKDFLLVFLCKPREETYTDFCVKSVKSDKETKTCFETVAR